MHGYLDVKSVKQFILHHTLKCSSWMNAMRIARNYRSRYLNSAHHSQKSISHWNVSCHITIVYHCIEFFMWILSIATWNLSHEYRLSPHRICHVDIVYRHIIIVHCHIVIVYHPIDVVTCSSSHSATFRATVVLGYPCMCPQWRLPLCWRGG